MKSPLLLLHSNYFDPIANLKRDCSAFKASPLKRLKKEEEKDVKNEESLKSCTDDNVNLKDIMHVEETKAVVENSDEDKKSLINHITISNSDVVEKKEEESLKVEAKNEVEVNLDLNKLLECDTKAESKPPSPGGSLFLFGTMFKNHEEVKDDEEEIIPDDSEKTEDDNDITTDNEVIEEVAETDVSVEFIGTDSIEAEDDNLESSSNNEEDVLLIRDEETESTSKEDSHENTDESVREDISSSSSQEEDIDSSPVLSPSKHSTKSCFVKCDRIEIPEDYKYLLSSSSNVDDRDNHSLESNDDEPMKDLDSQSEDSNQIECISLSDSEDDDDIQAIEIFEEGTVAIGEKCKECLAYGDRITIFDHQGGGLGQEEAVRDPRLCVVPWDWSVEENLDVCFKARNVSFYDKFSHFAPVDEGLLEKGVQLFFSGKIRNIVDNEEVQVDKIPIRSPWRRSADDKLIVMSMLENKMIEYTIESMSKDYQQAMDILDGKIALSISPKKKTNFPSLVSIPMSKVSVLVKPTSKANIKDKSPKKMPSSTTMENILSSPSPKKIQRVDPKLQAVLSSIPNKSKDQKKSSPISKPNRKRKSSGGFSKQSESSFDKEIATVLETFDKKPGFGDPLKKLLPSHLRDTSDSVSCFILFVLERQKVWVKKYKGKKNLTSNEILEGKWFTNMYRELDRGTHFFRRNILETTLKNYKISKEVDAELIEKVLFKSVIYRLINEVKTFNDFGGIPDRKEMKSFLKFIKERHEDRNQKVFTAAHQNNGMRRFLESYDVLKHEIKQLSVEIAKNAKKRSLKGINSVLRSIKGVGPFFAWQILCDLLEARIIGDNSDNQWTSLGPGAKNGLRRLFTESNLPSSKGELKHTRLIRDLCASSGPKSGYEALGLSFPAFLNKELSLKNIEHALCEYDKYYRSALGLPTREREYSDSKSNQYLDDDTKCSKCDKVGNVDKRVMCALCRRFYHHQCDESYQDKFIGSVWLCKDCHKFEKAWRKEDFDFEEYDEADEQNGTKFVSGAKKSARAKKKKKNENIEVVDLSSDEEMDDDDDDDIQYLSGDEQESFDADDLDPFDNSALWATDEDEDDTDEITSEDNEIDDDDDEIVCLS